MAETDSPQNPWILFDYPKPTPIGPGGEQQVLGTFMRPRNEEQELSLSERLYDRFIGGEEKPYQDAFQSYLNLMRRINDIHATYRSGRKRPEADIARSSISLNVIDANLQDIVGMHYADQAPDDYIQKLKYQTDLLGQQNSTWESWFYPKVYGLRLSIERWQGRNEWMEQLRDRFAKPEFDEMTTEEVRKSADQIVERIKENRAYGVKNCYFESPVVAKNGEVLYVMEPDLFALDHKVKQRMLPSQLAVLGYGKKPEAGIDVQEHVLIDRAFKKDVTVHSSGMVAAGGAVKDVMAITESGEIFSTPYSRISMRKVFQERGMGREYELFRLFITMRMHDLLTRADVVDGSASVEKFERQVVEDVKEKSNEDQQTRSSSPSFRELILPRTRPIEQEEDLPSGEKREMVKHDVVMHTRKLPKNYKPTQEAIEYALEHGITLGEHETVVKKHSRGTLEGEEKPIKAKFR